MAPVIGGAFKYKRVKRKEIKAMTATISKRENACSRRAKETGVFRVLILRAITKETFGKAHLLSIARSRIFNQQGNTHLVTRRGARAFLIATPVK
jgi:hypothetical protein